jgi:hypothetical protein
MEFGAVLAAVRAGTCFFRGTYRILNIINIVRPMSPQKISHMR